MQTGTSRKLDKVRRFSNWWFTQVTQSQWEDFIGHHHLPLTEHSAHTVINWILAGVDNFHWKALDKPFTL